ncbi:MAG: hypothetical protein ACYTGB_06070 [Planctomycetota bacterium]
MTTAIKVKTAAGAAWKVWLVSAGVTAFTYLAYLAMSAGWLDWLVGSGLYGSVTPAELARITFYYVGAVKLISTCFLLGALFLTCWARGLAAAGGKALS